MFAQSFVVDSVNVIHYAKPLMVDTASGAFNIVHIGDSHIQADWFSGKLRDLLQEKYGNAGKGLIFPYKQIKTNGPNTFGSFSQSNISGSKIARCRSTCDVGIAAYDAHLTKGNSIVFNYKRDTQEQFITAIYRSLDSQAVIFNSDYDTNNYKLISYQSYQTLTYQKPLSSPFSLQATSPITLNGLMASNHQKGILYYTIGANGATFQQYLNSTIFFEQLPTLKANLVIVSLGTNESVSDISPDSFYLHISSMYQHISEAYKHSNIIFTIPADNYKRHAHTVRKKVKGKWQNKRVVSYVNNTKMQQLREVMIAFCNEKQIMYWDLYEIMGGEKSMKTWVNEGYAAKDHIHFNKVGYELQAELLFKALTPLIINP
jgi:lysophospholipase L1-like esterase